MYVSISIDISNRHANTGRPDIDDGNRTFFLSGMDRRVSWNGRHRAGKLSKGDKREEGCIPYSK